MNISVIICCYNSAQRLSDTLICLSLQEVPDDFKWEVIIVDNNSTDNTGEIAIQIWKELNSQVSLRVIHEGSPGLSYARKKGVFEAEGEIIVFCDDDNWLNEMYLSTAFKIMNSYKEIGIVGGIAIPFSNIDFPDWFYQNQLYYACGPQNFSTGLMTKKNWLYGAGMVVRKAYMLKMYAAGFKSFLIDRTGESLSSGGDVELCYWHKIIDSQLWYDERLTFTHYIEKRRLCLDYFERLKNAITESSHIHHKYEIIFKFFNERSFIKKTIWLYHLRGSFNLLLKVSIAKFRFKYFTSNI
jgi:glycosyltransferase involved in cell wall biosynthesis